MSSGSARRCSTPSGSAICWAASPPKSVNLGPPPAASAARAAADLGLPAGIPVATGIIDAHAGGVALLGAAPEGGLAIISGTSCCHLIASRDPIMVPGVWGPYFGALLPGWWLNEGGQSARRIADRLDLAPDATPGPRCWRGNLPGGGRASSVYAVANDWVAALRGENRAGTHARSARAGRSSRQPFAARRSAVPRRVAGLTLDTGRTRWPASISRPYRRWRTAPVTSSKP